MSYKAGIVKNDSNIESQNFPTKEKAEEWVLKMAEKYKIKKSIIVNRENINEREITTW